MPRTPTQRAEYLPAPTPANRPTEWATSLTSATLGLVLLFWKTAPDGFATACLGFVAALAPVVTAIVTARRRRQGEGEGGVGGGPSETGQVVLLVLLVVLILLFGGFGLAVESLRWLLIVCVVLIAVSILVGRR